MPAAEPAAWIVVGRAAGRVTALVLDSDGAQRERHTVDDEAVAQWVLARERDEAPRWVWSDTPAWYTALVAAGVRLARCHDLRLVHAILRDATAVTEDHGLRRATEWDRPPPEPQPDRATALFELDGDASAGIPADIEAALAEFSRQRTALAAAGHGMRLLVAAECAGALLAVELRAAGVPWDAATHDAILIELLGSRTADGEPRRLTELGARVRAELGDVALSLDSQPKLLRALHRAGIVVESTSRWELSRHDHPAIEPLIEYKRLWRLWTANGWSWLDEWVRDRRFRPVYVPAGVITGRWASSGGGALQIPRRLRAAVRADPGWTFVVADVAQLEPRVLAAMAGDRRMADAARGRDLYAGIVESGVISTRTDAKVALLAAMYGATGGRAGRLMPSLRRSYPQAMRLVDEAARAGQDGGVVSTWLGRSSPAPSTPWRTAQAAATEADASGEDDTRARRSARDRGRFTRNFVVQGTAAEWALVWLADLRARLWAMPPVVAGATATASGPVFARRAHITFFLHDEIIVHTPADLAGDVADAVRDAAASAGRLLFADFPVDFPLDLHIADTAEKG